METILIFNGLGNQMSQYAFYISKCMSHQKCQLLVDQSIVSQHNGFELDRIFYVGYRDTWIKRLIHAMYYKVQYGTRLGHLLERLGVRIIRESRNYDYDCAKCKKGPYLINIYKGGDESKENFYNYDKEIRPILEEIYMEFKYLMHFMITQIESEFIEKNLEE